jgi:sugar-specific transcriptional regulator TrmB
VTQADVVAALVALGFNRNEGRAYATLVERGPATGYEVSQRSGVPRSAVYTVLRRLVDRGAARSIAGSPERFLATPADALVDLLGSRLKACGVALREAIARLDVTPAVPDAFSVKGYERVMEEAARLIASAQRLLLLSGWPRELGQLDSEIAAAQRRGAYVVVFSHARLPDSLPGVRFSSSLPEEKLEDFWNHKLVLVADDARTLIAATDRLPGDTAVLSETAAIAEFATGQIALDITLLAARHRFDASAIMARVLGDRVGRLDELLAAGARPELGRPCGAVDAGGSSAPGKARRTGASRRS